MSKEAEELTNKLEAAADTLAKVVHDMERILDSGPDVVLSNKKKIEVYDRWFSGEFYVRRASDLVKGDNAISFNGEEAFCLGAWVVDGANVVSFKTPSNEIHHVAADLLIFYPVDQADKAKT